MLHKGDRVHLAVRLGLAHLRAQPPPLAQSVPLAQLSLWHLPAQSAPLAQRRLLSLPVQSVPLLPWHLPTQSVPVTQRHRWGLPVQSAPLLPLLLWGLPCQSVPLVQRRLGRLPAPVVLEARLVRSVPQRPKLLHIRKVGHS